MSQSIVQEVNMDVFARRIAPYFSWLESRIESGWTQSDHIIKDVLKETKTLSTNMRARFILGVSKSDFVVEVQKALDLFELASDAFPDECDEIESKADSMTKGIAEELGSEFLPGNAAVSPQKPKVTIEAKVEVKVQPKVEKIEPVAPKVEPKVEMKTKESVIKIPSKKVEKPKAQVKKVIEKKEEKKAKIVKKVEKPKKPEVKKEQKISKLPKFKLPNMPKINVKIPKVQLPKVKFSKKGIKNFGPVKWVREFIFGED